MNEHTPGPWYHHHAPDGADYDWSLQTEREAFLMFNFRPDMSAHYQLGNARLIAAAPELYEYVASLAAAGCATAKALITKAEEGRS